MHTGLDTPAGSNRELRDGTVGALADRFDGLLLDLDGVCYLGHAPIPAAVETIAALRATHRMRFITNNASQPRHEVEQKLISMGINSDPGAVLTSADCAAQSLREHFGAGSPVLVVGGPGVIDALTEVGLRPVRSADDQPVAILQGWHRDVDWSMLAEAVIAIRAGAEWVATNLDLTLPSERGVLPGNGSLVRVVGAAVDSTPRSVGKPEPAMYAAARPGIERPLAVGDRLDTDIVGASREGIESLLVLSGVSSPTDLYLAGPDARPTYVSADLAGVLAPSPAVDEGPTGVFTCRDAVARIDGAGHIGASGTSGPDGCDLIRAAAVTAWAAVDAGRVAADSLTFDDRLRAMSQADH